MLCVSTGEVTRTAKKPKSKIRVSVTVSAPLMTKMTFRYWRSEARGFETKRTVCCTESCFSRTFTSIIKSKVHHVIIVSVSTTDIKNYRHTELYIFFHKANLGQSVQGSGPVFCTFIQKGFSLYIVGINSIMLYFCIVSLFWKHVEAVL